MREIKDLPEGIKAAAARFASACKRDGYRDGATITTHEGVPVRLWLFEGEKQTVWTYLPKSKEWTGRVYEEGDL